MKLPKISIITPTLNVEAVIEQALLSVANQKYTEIEHIIIDGKSTDNTISIIQDYQKRFKHIKLIQEKDTGIYNAMNKGINLCKGDWLYFLGADDELYDENVLSDLYSEGAFSQNRVFYGNVFIKGDTVWAKDSTIYDGSFDLKKLLLKNICHQAIFYPRHIVKEIGYYNEEYEVTADYDYNLRCFAKQDFLYVDRTIANFATGGKSSQAELDISFKNFASNVISYFDVETNNSSYYKPESPFYDLLSHYKYVLKTQLNPFTDKISTGISLFTAIKNREEAFEEALKTWVTHEQIDEIIIVDWSSDNSLLPIVNRYQNGKIKLVEVKDQDKWVLSHAYNLAARLTTKNKLLKIDADVKVLPGFFEKHTLKPGRFFAGDWEKARNENETHLNGNAFLYRGDFFSINGYNEFFKTYGWDDTDFFSRLEAMGLERLCFDFDTLHHIEHKGRMAFQSPSKKLNNLTDEEWSRINIFINRFVAKNIENWSFKNSMLQFTIDIDDDNMIYGNQAGDDINIIDGELINEGEIVAVRERLVELGLDLPDEIAVQTSNDEYIAYYNLYLLKDESTSASQLLSLFSKAISTYNANGRHKDRDVNRLTEIISKKDQTLQLKEKLLEESNQTIRLKEKLLVESNQTIRLKEKLLVENDQTIQLKEELIEEIKKAIQIKDKLIKEKDHVIQQIEHDIKEVNKLIDQKNQIILVRDQEISEKNKHIQIKDQSIKLKKQAILFQNVVIREREQAILKRDQVILKNAKLIKSRNQLLQNRYEFIRERN